MTPTQHPSNNAVLQAPPGVTHEECRPLAITRVKYSDDTPGVISYWRPSPAELAALAEGALVRFTAIGHTHPPISIAVEGVEEQ